MNLGARGCEGGRLASLKTVEEMMLKEIKIGWGSKFESRDCPGLLISLSRRALLNSMYSLKLESVIDIPGVCLSARVVRKRSA